MPHHCKFQKQFIASALIIVITLVVMASCLPIPPTEISAKDLATQCPEQTPIAPTPFIHTTTNKYIIVLIDKSASYRLFVTQHDYAVESLTLIKDVLPRVLIPGDRILIGWIANDGDDRNKIIIESEIQNATDTYPIFESTPVRPEADPTLIVDGTDIQKDKIRKKNKETELQNQIKQQGYYCEIYEWQLTAESTNIKSDEDWQERYHQIIEGFLPPLRDGIDNAIKEKPSQETRLYQGLSVASRKFHEPLIGKGYNKYILIIFSDMKDSSRDRNKSTKYDIDLTNVDVIIPNYLCLESYTDCLKYAASIQDQFTNSYNAKSTIVKFPVETDQQILGNFISKGD